MCFNILLSKPIYHILYAILIILHLNVGVFIIFIRDIMYCILHKKKDLQQEGATVMNHYFSFNIKIAIWKVNYGSNLKPIHVIF